MSASNPSHKYYDVFEDMRNYPDADIIVAYSRRGVGKTYGALLGALRLKAPIFYIKRTNADIDLLCKNDPLFDTSPYKPINRDIGTNIKAKKLDDGIAYLYHADADGKPCGDIVAYAVSLNAISKVKGFDASDALFMIFDEFIPQAFETHVSKAEGRALLSVYETVSRDRIKRGREPLRLLLFANAEQIYCPVVSELEIMNDLATLATSKRSIYYNKERGILLHHVTEIPLTEEETNRGVARAMKGTAFYRMSYEGDFAYNDFSNISKKALKQYKPLLKITYKRKDFFVYQKDNLYYITYTRSNKYIAEFNLDRDNHVRLFQLRYVIALQEACMNGCVAFSDYDLYDLIYNYSKRFKDKL